MYDSLAPRPGERRLDPRLRLQLYLNQYIKERPYRALAVDISETGLAVHKLTEPVVPHATTIGLEVELPGTGEIIWAAAESRFDEIGPDFHVSGLRFCAMARKHQKLLRDYVRERRLRLARLLRFPLHA
ncbi:MAG TPA: PilZ domain-containing protein [Polyangia bacterium]|nr:PilZ domain-containing protein [Polyangia bacterium]